MILEYRFKGTGPTGRPVQGTFTAGGAGEAREYLNNLRSRYQITLDKLERRRDFLYKVYVPGRKPSAGRQSAFSREEVEEGLRRMGYEDIKISRVLFDLPFKPSIQDVLMFIRLSANMLRDKMNFSKILQMLAGEQRNRMFKEALFQIDSQLRAGAEGREVFQRFHHIFGRFPAYMLGLATRSGNMSEIFDATATFIERDVEIKKTVKKALLSPAITILATLLAFGYYVIAIFPATAGLFAKYDMETPALTQATLDFSNWLIASWWIVLLILAGVILVLWLWWRTSKGRIWRDRNLVRIPVIGPLVHKMSIEIYFRVFGTIYSGSGDNIETIRIAAEACRNAWMEDRIKNVTLPRMLEKGEGFVEAMEASGVFTKMSITRLRTGQTTGNLLTSSQQIANFYQAETEYRMANAIEVIQSVVWLFVGAAITFLTLVSAEVANISPPTY